MIIGLSGKRGAGKDTVCDRLRLGIPLSIKRGFADAMKDLLCDAFDVPPAVAWGDNKTKEQLVPRTETTVRKALQIIGQCYKEIEPLHWTRRLMEQAAIAEERYPGIVVLVNDVRFPHEVEAIQGAGGVVIRLTRCGTADTHISETALDGYTGFDLVVDNRFIAAAETYAAVATFLRARNILKIPDNYSSVA